MDVEGRIGCEVLQLLADPVERLLLPQPLVQQLFQRGHERLGGLGVLSPDLQRETQEGQIEFQFLLVMSALAGEVRRRFGCTGQSRGTVLYHVLLALMIALLASPTLVFSVAVAFVAMRHD